MPNYKIFGGENDIIKTKLHGLTQEAYVVTEEKVNSFNNYSFEFQIAISVFSISLGGVIGSLTSYGANDLNLIVFWVCLIVAFLSLLLLIWSLCKFNNIRKNLFIKVKDSQIEPMLQILKVIYSTSEKEINITDKINNMLLNNKLSFIVSNEIAGIDPQKGTPKIMEIKYTFKGETLKKEYKEGEKVNLP